MTVAADDAIALALAHGLPYAGLRDVGHDDTLVPADVARAARVVALRADSERVRLAVAAPDADLDGVRPHLGGRSAELVIAPRAEIDAILGPAPPPPPPPPAPAPEAEMKPEPTPEPVADAAEEPSWLAPAPARRGPPLLVLVAIALLLIAATAAVAVWLST